MKTKGKLKYEEQKQEVLQVAEEHFGKEYFDKLEQILSKIVNEEENKYQYKITVNTKGAFYALEK